LPAAQIVPSPDDGTDAPSENAGVRTMRGHWRWRRILLWTGIGLVVVFGLMQAVPYGRAHSNPPVQSEPRWASRTTRALAAAACFDCHSNLTNWRWYSNIAPGSWLIQRDVSEGRSQFNFSEWAKPQDVSAGDLAEAIDSGSMPPWYYRLMHPNAGLSSSEKATLIKGLQATLAASPPKGGGG
jgi:hypothetical protein